MRWTQWEQKVGHCHQSPSPPPPPPLPLTFCPGKVDLLMRKPPIFSLCTQIIWHMKPNCEAGKTAFDEGLQYCFLALSAVQFMIHCSRTHHIFPSRIWNIQSYKFAYCLRWACYFFVPRKGWAYPGLRVLEDRLLRRMFGREQEEVTGRLRYLPYGELHDMCILRKIILVWFTSRKMCRTCTGNDEEEKRAWHFRRKSWRKEATWGSQA
jgi:hypothetical protein